MLRYVNTGTYVMVVYRSLDRVSQDYLDPAEESADSVDFPTSTPKDYLKMEDTGII